MKMREFKFDEVRPKLVASNFKPNSDYRKPPPKRMPPKGYWVVMDEDGNVMNVVVGK